MGEEEVLGVPGPREEIIEPEYPVRKGLLKVKCSCGVISNISEEIVEHGLSWSMIIGNDHFLALMCPSCNAKLTMYIEEIIGENELPKESIEE